MRVARSSQIDEEPLTEGQFSGPVARPFLGRLDRPEGAALLVQFPHGARPGWHRHAGGQVLFVVDGAGRVGTRDGQTAALGVGDLVYAPPGEEHWHGAAEGSDMRHLALSLGETEWLGLVEE